MSLSDNFKKSQLIAKLMKRIDEWESSDKQGLLEEVLSLLSVDQVEKIYNTQTQQPTIESKCQPLDPYQEYVMSAIARDAIAGYLNGAIDEEGLPVGHFDDDDWRLTDQICQQAAGVIGSLEEGMARYERTAVVAKFIHEHFMEKDNE